MREREIRCVIEDDDETNKQAKAKLKNKENHFRLPYLLQMIRTALTKH